MVLDLAASVCPKWHTRSLAVAYQVLYVHIICNPSFIWTGVLQMSCNKNKGKICEWARCLQIQAYGHVWTSSRDWQHLRCQWLWWWLAVWEFLSWELHACGCVQDSSWSLLVLVCINLWTIPPIVSVVQPPGRICSILLYRGEDNVHARRHIWASLLSQHNNQGWASKIGPHVRRVVVFYMSSMAWKTRICIEKEKNHLLAWREDTRVVKKGGICQILGKRNPRLALVALPAPIIHFQTAKGPLPCTHLKQILGARECKPRQMCVFLWKRGCIQKLESWEGFLCHQLVDSFTYMPEGTGRYFLSLKASGQGVSFSLIDLGSGFTAYVFLFLFF